MLGNRHISLTGDSLSSLSPLPELELRLQVAQRIQEKSPYPRSAWMPGLPPSCHVGKLGPRVGSKQPRVTQLEKSKIPKVVSFPPCLPAFFLGRRSHGGSQILKPAGLGETGLRGEAWGLPGRASSIWQD